MMRPRLVLSSSVSQLIKTTRALSAGRKTGHGARCIVSLLAKKYTRSAEMSRCEDSRRDRDLLARRERDDTVDDVALTLHDFRLDAEVVENLPFLDLEEENDDAMGRGRDAVEDIREEEKTGEGGEDSRGETVSAEEEEEACAA